MLQVGTLRQRDYAISLIVIQRGSEVRGTVCYFNSQSGAALIEFRICPVTADCARAEFLPVARWECEVTHPLTPSYTLSLLSLCVALLETGCEGH